MPAHLVFEAEEYRFLSGFLVCLEVGRKILSGVVVLFVAVALAGNNGAAVCV